MQPYRHTTESGMDRIYKQFQESMKQYKAQAVPPPSPRPTSNLTPPTSPKPPTTEYQTMTTETLGDGSRRETDYQSVKDAPRETKVAMGLNGNSLAVLDISKPGPSKSCSSGASPAASAGQTTSRRLRLSFSVKQLVRLEKEYSTNKFIHRVNRLLLAEELGIPERSIKTWFQNRRMKDKNPGLTRSWPPYTEKAKPTNAPNQMLNVPDNGNPLRASTSASPVVPRIECLPAVPHPSLPDLNNSLPAAGSHLAPYPGVYMPLILPPYTSLLCEAPPQAYGPGISASAIRMTDGPPVIKHFRNCPRLLSPALACRCGLMYPPVSRSSSISDLTPSSLTSPPVPELVQKKKKSSSDLTAKESNENWNKSVSEPSKELSTSSNSSVSTRPKLFKPYEEEQEARI